MDYTNEQLTTWRQQLSESCRNRNISESNSIVNKFLEQIKVDPIFQKTKFPIVRLHRNCVLSLVDCIDKNRQNEACVLFEYPNISVKMPRRRRFRKNSSNELNGSLENIVAAVSEYYDEQENSAGGNNLKHEASNAINNSNDENMDNIVNSTPNAMNQQSPDSSFGFSNLSNNNSKSNNNEQVDPIVEYKKTRSARNTPKIIPIMPKRKTSKRCRQKVSPTIANISNETEFPNKEANESLETKNLIQDVVDILTQDDANSVYKQKCIEKEYNDMVTFEPLDSDKGDEILIMLPRCKNVRARIDLTSLERITRMTFGPVLEARKNELRSLQTDPLQCPSGFNVTRYTQTTTTMTDTTIPIQQESYISNIDEISEQQQQEQDPFVCMPVKCVIAQPNLESCSKPIVIHENEHGSFETFVPSDGVCPFLCVFKPKSKPPAITQCNTKSTKTSRKRSKRIYSNRISRKRTQNSTSKKPTESMELQITSEVYNKTLLLEMPVAENCEANDTINDIKDNKPSNGESIVKRGRGRPFKNGVSKAIPKKQVWKPRPGRHRKKTESQKPATPTDSTQMPSKTNKKRTDEIIVADEGMKEEETIFINNESYIAALDMPILTEEEKGPPPNPNLDLLYECQLTAAEPPFNGFLQGFHPIEHLENPTNLQISDSFLISNEEKQLLECFNNGEVGQVLGEMDISSDLIESEETTMHFTNYSIGDELKLRIENSHHLQLSETPPPSSSSSSAAMNQLNAQEELPAATKEPDAKSNQIYRNFQSYINDHSYSIVAKNSIKTERRLPNANRESLLKTNFSKFTKKLPVRNRSKTVKIIQVDDFGNAFHPQCIKSITKRSSPSNMEKCVVSSPQNCTINNNHEEGIHINPPQLSDQCIKFKSPTTFSNNIDQSFPRLCYLNSIQNSPQNLIQNSPQNLIQNSPQNSLQNSTSKPNQKSLESPCEVESKTEEKECNEKIKNNTTISHNSSRGSQSRMSFTNSTLQESDFLLPPLELDSKLEDILNFELSSLSESEEEESNHQSSNSIQTNQLKKSDHKSDDSSSSTSSDSSSSSSDSDSETSAKKVQNCKSTKSIGAKKLHYEKTGVWPTSSESSDSECEELAKTKSNEAMKKVQQREKTELGNLAQKNTEHSNVLLEDNNEKIKLACQQDINVNRNSNAITERPTTPTTTKSNKTPNKMPENANKLPTRRKSDIFIPKCTLTPSQNRLAIGTGSSRPNGPIFKIPKLSATTPMAMATMTKPIPNNRSLLKPGSPECSNVQKTNLNAGLLPNGNINSLPQLPNSTNVTNNVDTMMNNNSRIISRRNSMQPDLMSNQYPIKNPISMIAQPNARRFSLTNERIPEKIGDGDGGGHELTNEKKRETPTRSVSMMANFFNITCFPSLIQQCPYGISCFRSHHLRDGDSIREALKSLSLTEVDILYKFAYTYKLLYMHYFNEFAYYYAEQYKINRLCDMLIDGQRYLEFRANKFYIIYKCLMDCQVNKSTACRMILENVRRRSPDILKTIFNIIVDSDWTLFANEVREIIYEHNIVLNESTISKMSASFISNYNVLKDIHMMNIFLNCIFKLDAEEMYKIKGHPALQQIISNVFQLSRGIPDLSNNQNYGSPQ